MTDADRDVSKADQYRHPDGTVEVVYALEGDTVLTFREYPSEEAFDASVADADYLGEHSGVAELPDVADAGDPDAGSDAVDDVTPGDDTPESDVPSDDTGGDENSRGDPSDSSG